MAAHGQQAGDLLPAAGPPQTPLCLPPQAPQEVRPPFHHHQTSLLPQGTSNSAVSSACLKHVSLRPRSDALRTFAFQPNMEGALQPATATCRMPQNASLLESWACKGQLLITDAPCVLSGHTVLQSCSEDMCRQPEKPNLSGRSVQVCDIGDGDATERGAPHGGPGQCKLRADFELRPRELLRPCAHEPAHARLCEARHVRYRAQPVRAQPTLTSSLAPLDTVAPLLKIAQSLGRRRSPTHPKLNNTAPWLSNNDLLLDQSPAASFMASSAMPHTGKGHWTLSLSSFKSTQSLNTSSTWGKLAFACPDDDLQVVLSDSLGCF
jgi:hypothetical protein